MKERDRQREREKGGTGRERGEVWERLGGKEREREGLGAFGRGCMREGVRLCGSLNDSKLLFLFEHYMRTRAR